MPDVHAGKGSPDKRDKMEDFPEDLKVRIFPISKGRP